MPCPEKKRFCKYILSWKWGTGVGIVYTGNYDDGRTIRELKEILEQGRSQEQNEFPGGEVAMNDGMLQMVKMLFFWWLISLKWLLLNSNIPSRCILPSSLDIFVRSRLR